MATSCQAAATATATTVLRKRLPITKKSSSHHSSLLLPSLSLRLSTASSLRTSFKQFSGKKGFILYNQQCLYTSYNEEVRNFSSLRIRASSDDESSSSLDINEVFTDLKDKWDAVENKSTVLLYGGGAVVALWLSSVLVGAIDSIPLVPKIMEVVGLGYSGWFVYRYLLFKTSRKELAEDIEALKKKIAGTE